MFYQHLMLIAVTYLYNFIGHSKIGYIPYYCRFFIIPNYYAM